MAHSFESLRGREKGLLIMAKLVLLVVVISIFQYCKGIRYFSTMHNLHFVILILIFIAIKKPFYKYISIVFKTKK
jgi:hypothetical protein